MGFTITQCVPLDDASSAPYLSSCHSHRLYQVFDFPETFVK
jgi:hypothetical protein